MRSKKSEGQFKASLEQNKTKKHPFPPVPPPVFLSDQGMNAEQNLLPLSAPFHFHVHLKSSI